MIQELPCLSCNGRGEFYYICENKMLPCRPCKSTGKQMRDPAWLEQGQKIREARIAAGRSLRDEAKRLGIDIVALSAAERGVAAVPLSAPVGKP